MEVICRDEKRIWLLLALQNRLSAPPIVFPQVELVGHSGGCGALDIVWQMIDLGYRVGCGVSQTELKLDGHQFGAEPGVFFFEGH